VSGSLDAAQQALQEGLRLARKLNNVALIAALSNDLGNVFTSQNRYAEALEAYGESVWVAEQQPDRALAVRALINAATASMQQGQYQVARTRLDMALGTAAGCAAVA
jgi:tetratricopeptide (TPR) repeat protein